MKKRLEDQLIELAFDHKSDSVPPELADNFAAKARLSEYQAMRTALGQLRDIPEHQLSTERLREALLHRGLKRRYQFPWMALGYGSVACTFFFCAFFASRYLRAIHQPTRLVEPPRALASATVNADLLNFMIGPWDSNSTSNQTNQNVRLVRRHHAPREVLIHQVSNSKFAMLDKPQRSISSAVGSPNLSKNGAIIATDGVVLDGDNNPVRATSKPVARLASTIDSFVVIKPSTDADTGLDTAQEVTDKSNVLVGG